MATVSELKSAVEALDSTINLEHEGDDLHHGVTRKTYTWTRRDARGALKVLTLRMGVWSDGGEQAAWYGQVPDDPEANPEPRVSESQVLSFYPNAENINITRSNDLFDEVRFDDYDSSTKKAVKRLVRIKFDGGSYEKHYEVENEYEQV